MQIKKKSAGKSQKILLALAAATAAFVSFNIQAAEPVKLSTKDRTKIRVRTSQKDSRVEGRVGIRAGKRIDNQAEKIAGGRVGIRASERVGIRVMDKTKIVCCRMESVL